MQQQHIVSLFAAEAAHSNSVSAYKGNASTKHTVGTTRDVQDNLRAYDKPIDACQHLTSYGSSRVSLVTRDHWNSTVTWPNLARAYTDRYKSKNLHLAYAIALYA